MSVYEKVKAELARKNLELEQQQEQRRRHFDVVFEKIVPRLENYLQKESEALLRDGGHAQVTTRLESPLRSITKMVFALPHDQAGVPPSHSYQLTVTMERICSAEGQLNIAQPKPAEDKPTLQEVLGGLDAPDFLIKLDKSLTKFFELAMQNDSARNNK
jgi:hypothetical protein